MNVGDIVDWLKQHAQGSARLCLDSRQLRAGDVFFACPARGGDGREYISDALARGAVAVIMEADSLSQAPQLACPVLLVKGLTPLLGAIADQWYGHPSAQLSVVAVTGTNGKTSCVNWVAAALNAEGVPCGTVGTLGARLPGGNDLGGSLTTPDVLSMHYLLDRMRAAGAQVVAIEASSIGIEQGRLDHVRVKVAGFTNLTHDHLDYHHTWENYKQAKFALFTFPGLEAAIINHDDAAGRELLSRTLSAKEVVAYSLGKTPTAQVKALDIHAGTHGLAFALTGPSGTAQVLTRIVGEHNVANLLLVSSVLSYLGWDLPRIARVLASLSPVQGRLEWVDPVVPQGVSSSGLPLVVVDYAHTPDALERALTALRDVAQARSGRLVCIFGCGGQRDTAKRPLMGRVAADLADHVVVTTDNPRNEDPQAIIQQILSGMPRAAQVQLDRATAILETVWSASAADVILIAGKGHETWQEFAWGKIPFDDRHWAGVALTWRSGVTLSSDTRSLKEGDLFLALKGENFDGHGYLSVAKEKGALAAIVQAADPDVALPQFVLGDTRQALAKLATVWRALLAPVLIAVTGSNGKTTTKEMVASILRCAYGDDAMLATRGNLNNDIGVPLTLLRLNPAHKAAVIELGMNHPGEIAQLAAMAQPTIALVNNAQREHQEFMHSVQAVAAENGAVIQSLPNDGTAVFPGDDEFTAMWLQLAGSRPVLRFGFDPGFQVHADHIHAEREHTQFVLNTQHGSVQVSLRAPGLHNLRNAMAAAACALAAGVELDAVRDGLQAFNPVAGRMQPYALSATCQLIDDTYNANPDSVRAAIDVLASLDQPRILVLGDMAEVGANSDAMHAEVGAYARERGINHLFALGSATRHSVTAFGESGRSFEDVESLVHALVQQLPANVLVKGSRSARMERVIHRLKEHVALAGEGDHAA